MLLLFFLTALWDETYQGMEIHVRDDDIAWRWRFINFTYAVLYLVLEVEHSISYDTRPVC